MRQRRTILAAVAAGAVLLVLGRAFAHVYTEFAWYSALGATSLWREWLADTVILHTVAFVTAGAFALANFSAVRHSILSLVLPRRLANVEFAEAVPPRRLDWAAIVLALLVGLAATAAVPPWTSLAMVRARLGIALVPRLGRQPLGPDLVAVAARRPVPTREIVALHRRSMADSPAVRAVVDRLSA